MALYYALNFTPKLNSIMINITKLTFLISIVFFCIATSNAQTSNKGKLKTLKVMTYNIHIGNPPSKGAGFVDMIAIARVINKYKPDLVALQEVDVNTLRSGKGLHQAKELSRLTGMNFFFAKAVDRSEGDYGVAVLSRFPIIEEKGYRLPVTEGSQGEIRGAALIIVQAKDQKIAFVSSHFDHMSDKDRQLQSEKLNEVIRAHAEYPLIVGADFNMTPENEVMNVLKEELIPGCSACPLTFSAVKPTETIDYIMQNKKSAEFFKIANYETISEPYASDHLPVVAEFQVKK